MRLNNDNAANRLSYVGLIYDMGAEIYKNNILNSLKEEYARLHKDGYIHIHDLDAYGLTYNCLTFDIISKFPYDEFKNYSDQGKLIHLFEFIKKLFIDTGNEQSGGMAFANFDNEIAIVLEGLSIDYMKYKELIKELMNEFILWCASNYTRQGKTTYYITLNVGLADNECARYICKCLLEEFIKSGDLIFKPNIVFKVKSGINLEKGTYNYDLFNLALESSTKKMIPTYLLCDAKCNVTFDPKSLSIMGCRTRVVDNIYGPSGALGRGNISNISINLPRLALEIDSFLELDDKVKLLKEKWLEIASNVKDILLDRYYKLCKQDISNFPTNLKYHLWCEDFTNDLEKVFRNGTLSIGFIGLSEAIEILTGKKFYNDIENILLSLGFVQYMRSYIDMLKVNYNLNFSLLATAGELISGRFIDIDSKKFSGYDDIFNKGYYTNSFHIDVDSNLEAYKKIKLEGLFHEYCNGGCISYIELGEAPLNNIEALEEYIHIAISSGTHYLGFNFPKDICNDCDASGVFDTCPICGSKNITRLRRVSGYLEVLDGFTEGKKAEEKNRRKNI